MKTPEKTITDDRAKYAALAFGSFKDLRTEYRRLHAALLLAVMSVASLVANDSNFATDNTVTKIALVLAGVSIIALVIYIVKELCKPKIEEQLIDYAAYYAEYMKLQMVLQAMEMQEVLTKEMSTPTVPRRDPPSTN